MWNMDPTIIASIIGAVATVGAGVGAALVAREHGKSAGRNEVIGQIDDAPRKYVNELDKLITAAMRQGRADVIINARAIVSLRDALRNSMVQISTQLNGNIDRLASEIGETNLVGQPPPYRQPASTDTIYQTLQVLAITWPGRKEIVEVELRKLLAELGLYGRAPDRPNGPANFQNASIDESPTR
jgi:hypothetical protein